MRKIPQKFINSLEVLLEAWEKANIVLYFHLASVKQWIMESSPNIVLRLSEFKQINYYLFSLKSENQGLVLNSYILDLLP